MIIGVVTEIWDELTQTSEKQAGYEIFVTKSNLKIASITNCDAIHSNCGNFRNYCIMEKYCTRCKIYKKYDFFGIRKNGKYRSWCKTCNNEYSQTYRKENPKKVNESNNRYRKNNPEKVKTWENNYVTKNKEKLKKRRNKNSKKYREKSNNKILHACRVRINKLLKEISKSYNTLNLIGCSEAFLREWLEYQFTSKMNWDNHGSYWHIDHVIPGNLFDLDNKYEQFICFNWSNLQPLIFKPKNMVCTPYFWIKSFFNL